MGTAYRNIAVKLQYICEASKRVPRRDFVFRRRWKQHFATLLVNPWSLVERRGQRKLSFEKAPLSYLCSRKSGVFGLLAGQFQKNHPICGCATFFAVALSPCPVLSFMLQGGMHPPMFLALQIVRRSAREDDLSTTSLPKCTNSREQQFHKLLQFVRDRTGRVKVVKAGQVRATAWLRLFQLASKAEHLEAISEMFPRWRESGSSFSSLDVEMFVRRCEELDCPLLALKVFGDHPKYGLPLSSFPAARTLLHSLYRTYPLENVIAAVSLFGVNNLSPVTNDPASCAMFYAACLRSKNKHASLLGRDVRIALQTLLNETTPYPEPKEKNLRARYSVKPDIWLLEALRDIKKTKKDQGRGASWITEWLARGEGRLLPMLAERRYRARHGNHGPDALSAPTTSGVRQALHA
ncbi:hypothetical protein JVU11DRAFT_7690 [Chiua virens]|nr:hypothetical protein JVU11DRAFT_7690 [Chiua virens]